MSDMIKEPVLNNPAFVADSADIYGNVQIDEDCSIFFNATIRSESNLIHIGRRTNIQDGCILHTDTGYDMNIGQSCTIGHGAILHGCTIGDETLVGMGAIILNGAKIGKHCIIGAGAMVTQGKEIPDGSLVVGAPGKVIRQLNEEAIQGNIESADGYVAEGHAYAKLLNEKE